MDSPIEGVGTDGHEGVVWDLRCLLEKRVEDERVVDEGDVFRLKDSILWHVLAHAQTDVVNL